MTAVTTPANPDQPADVWIVPKVPVDPAWITPTNNVWSMASDPDVMTPDEAREFAALYLAAADEAEKRRMLP